MRQSQISRKSFKISDIIQDMTGKLKQLLIDRARQEIKKDDPSHDFLHAARVSKLAEDIAKEEDADQDIVVAAALFHDVIVYPKNHPDSKNEAEESAEYACKILQSISEFPKDKIDNVMTCIQEHSFSKQIIPKLLEAKILQDADKLEATGAISIMRTFASAGQMKTTFYNEADPFCKNRSPEPFNYAVDLFYARLLKVESLMHTKYAKSLAKKRAGFLRIFLQQLSNELEGK